MSITFEQIFDQFVRLPQLPHVMRQLVDSLRDEDVSLPELSALVGNDQVLTAKVLRLANSSYYGAMRSVASINDAVVLMGLNSFRNLVIASSLANTFPRIEGLDLSAFWRNSMLVANLSQFIGRNLKNDQDTLFTAGLIHSIGQLLIYLCFPDTAHDVFEGCKGKTPVEQRIIEQELLHLDHFEVGMELTRRWNFPDRICEVIGHYDNPATDDLQSQVVHAAVLIAHGIQEGSTFDDMLADLPKDSATILGLNRDWFEENGEVFDLLLDESASLV